MYDLINKTFAESKRLLPLISVGFSKVSSYDGTNTFYCYDNLGFEVMVHDETDLVSMVVIYPRSQLREGYSELLKLPLGVSFNTGRREVEQMLGKPELFFQSESDPLLGKQNCKARYNMGAYLMFLDYSEDEKHIEQISYTSVF